MDCLSGGCNEGISLEQKLALQQVQCNTKTRGSEFFIKLDDEQTVSRDEYGSIKNRSATPIRMYANPIEFQPIRKTKDRNGIKEDVQVMITTPMQCWLDNGFSDKDLSEIDSIRATVILRGQTYEIVDKALQGQFGNTFLYVVLGLKRK